MNVTNTTTAPAFGDAIGTRELSAWQTRPGFVWLQSRSPKYSGKLSRRSDARLVAVGVAGGFLRTFEFRHSLSWARKLIARYTTSETRTNARLNAPTCPARRQPAEARDK